MSLGKQVVESDSMATVNQGSEKKTYMERMQQVYRHYTVNDLNTLGMGGYLKMLKDLNLLKQHPSK